MNSGDSPGSPGLKGCALAACASAGHSYGGGGQYHGSKNQRRPKRISQYSHVSQGSLVEDKEASWEGGGLEGIKEGGDVEKVVANTGWLRELIVPETVTSWNSAEYGSWEPPPDEQQAVCNGQDIRSQQFSCIYSLDSFDQCVYYYLRQEL